MTEIGVISAYFTQEKIQENKVSVGENESKIEEEFPDSSIKEINLKKVEIHNKQSVPCFVRVKLLWSDSNVKEKSSLDIDNTKWEYNQEDDYYYYKEVLPPDIGVASFFSILRVQNPSEQDNFDITIYEETYQQGNFLENQYKEAFLEYQKNRGNGHGV
ncbi:MAG: hypothetical protein ACI4F9_02270 [Lachnospiraceae bacterium]